MTETDNMKLWNQVCETNPKDIKSFKGKGGFKGTAINAQSQRKRATELWGSFGSTEWGIRNEVFELLHLSEDPHDAVLTYSAELYYPDGSFGIHSDLDIWMYVKTYSAWVKNNDMRKKVRTDAFTKGLSELGFNSDIFEGKGALGYSDNKYIASKTDVVEPEPIREKQVQQIFQLQSDLKIDSKDFEKRLRKRFEVDNIDRLDTNQGAELIRLLKAA